jgi:hypothetical protein
MSTIADLMNSIQSFSDKVLNRLSGKVDAVAGKQLSTEDFSTEEKTKLEGVKSMAMRDLHVSTALPDNQQGADGDIWLVVKP